MADTVTGPTILQQNDKRVVIKIVNQSDGSGGTTVFADVSALAANADTSPKTVVLPVPSDWFTILITTLLSFCCRIVGPVTVSAMFPSLIKKL